MRRTRRRSGSRTRGRRRKGRCHIGRGLVINDPPTRLYMADAALLTCAEDLASS
jgi:hypothetical protein